MQCYYQNIFIPLLLHGLKDGPEFSNVEVIS